MKKYPKAVLKHKQKQKLSVLNKFKFKKVNHKNYKSKKLFKEFNNRS